MEGGDGEQFDVTLTVNSDCPMECPTTVSFGTQLISGGSCNITANVSREDPLSPGETVTFSLEPGSVSLEAGEKYCYHVSRPCDKNRE